MDDHGSLEHDAMDGMFCSFLGELEENSGEGVKIIPYELRRNEAENAWESIKVGSLDWRQTEKLYPRSLVIRVSSIVNENQPEEIIKNFKESVNEHPVVNSALHVVCMFKEFSIAEHSPIRYTANLWFIFPSLEYISPEDFEISIAKILPQGCISYVTLEMLTAFLTRREYEAKSISSQEARTRLRKYMTSGEPCSSLFLKLSPESPEFCRHLLMDVRGKTISAKHLVGVRAIHKLAVSCTSADMSSSHNFNETINVMKIAVDPKDWNFVVFKTLTRLATKHDRAKRIDPMKAGMTSNVVRMLNYVDHSHLQFTEKIAIRLIAKDYKCPPSSDTETSELVEFIHGIITCPDDELSVDSYNRILELIEDGSPATCHLTGVLLEKCVEQENFNIGWKIASSVQSVNEHTIEEIVTLCSKAFFKFSRNNKDTASQWFDRVFWCVERHYKLLGKYPSGLALHVAAHTGNFELCWKWFVAKKDEKSFRFTAHHTSSILKVATYCPEPAIHMERVLQAYKMTPHKEKSPFVFEPLYHLWGITESIRNENSAFWEMVHKDLRHYLAVTRFRDENTKRKIRKLSGWENQLNSWRTSKNGCDTLSKSRRSTLSCIASVKEKRQLRSHSSTGSLSSSDMAESGFSQAHIDSTRVSRTKPTTSMGTVTEEFVASEPLEQDSTGLDRRLSLLSLSSSVNGPASSYSSLTNLLASRESVDESLPLNFPSFSASLSLSGNNSSSSENASSESMSPELDPIYTPPARNPLLIVNDFDNSSMSSLGPCRSRSTFSSSGPVGLGMDKVWSSSKSTPYPDYFNSNPWSTSPLNNASNLVPQTFKSFLER